jgi:hypothetical protein
LLDEHVAVMVVTAAPFPANAPNATRSDLAPTLVTAGLFGGAGVPTTAAFDAVEAGLVPRAFVVEIRHV